MLTGKCLIFKWWIELMWNRTNVPKRYFNETTVLSFCYALKYVHFRHFGELKTRFLDIVHFAQPNNFGNSFEVWKFIILLLWVKCVIFEWLIEQSCNHTNVPTPNFKVINSSAPWCWDFLYIHFLHFGDLKTRFLHIASLTIQTI